MASGADCDLSDEERIVNRLALALLHNLTYVSNAAQARTKLTECMRRQYPQGDCGAQ